MKRVLRRLDYLDKEEIVQRKAFVACQISACDEILATELLFAGVFNQMDSSSLAAVLSCLVHDQNDNTEKISIKTEKLQKSFQVIMEHAKRIFVVLQESKINIEEVIKNEIIFNKNNFFIKKQ